MRLAVVHLHFPLFFFLFFFLLRSTPSHGMLSISGSHALYTRPTTTLTVKFPLKLHYSVGPMYYSRDPQASFFNKIFIKNGSHSTIHTFKNYFATIFSVFSKISISKRTRSLSLSHLSSSPSWLSNFNISLLMNIMILSKFKFFFFFLFSFLRIPL